MAKTTIGQLPCPECQAVQPVQSDGLKYFIHCTECHTFIHYQKKEAKRRIKEKLFPVAPEPLPVSEPEPEPATPATASPVKTRSLFDVLAQYL